MSKKTIAVLFGGQSSEHIVSCMSAVNVIDQIDTLRFITHRYHRIRTLVKSRLCRGDPFWRLERKSDGSDYLS